MPTLSDDLRKKFKIRDTVKGIVILDIEANSPAADKRLNAGDVIVEIAQEAVPSADDFQSKVERLRKKKRPHGAAAGRGCRRRTAVRGAELAVAANGEWSSSG